MYRMGKRVYANSRGEVQRLLRPVIVSLSLLTLLVAGGIVSAAYATTDPYIQTPHDTIPNFAQTPTIRSNVPQGNWDDATAWTPAQVPGPTDVVAIRTGHTVTVRDQTAAACLREDRVRLPPEEGSLAQCPKGAVGHDESGHRTPGPGRARPAPVLPQECSCARVRKALCL